MLVTNRPRVAVIGCGYCGRNLVRNFDQLGALRWLDGMRTKHYDQL